MQDTEWNVAQADMNALISALRRDAVELAPEQTGVHADLPRLTEIKAVVFDIYGTLFVSGSGDIGVHEETDDAGAVEAALQEAGLRCSGDAGRRGADALVTAIHAEHAVCREQGIAYPEVEIRDIWQRVLADLHEAGALDETPAPAQVMRVAVEYEKRVNPVWPMPELKDVLLRLKEYGLPLGIVSNAQFYSPLLFPAFLQGSLSSLGFELDLCVWSYRERFGKPSVELYETARHRLAQRGIDPAAVLYVGNDMLKDVWAARQVGFRTALFAGDRRSLRLREDDPRCASVRPDVVVTELYHVLRLLGLD